MIDHFTKYIFSSNKFQYLFFTQSIYIYIKKLIYSYPQGRLGSGSPGLPPTLPAPSPSALTTSASANFHSSTPAPATTSAIKNSTSAASFTTHAVIETRSFGPQTLPLRSQVCISFAICHFCF